jgi:hypothetical protein
MATRPYARINSTKRIDIFFIFNKMRISMATSQIYISMVVDGMISGTK